VRRRQVPLTSHAAAQAAKGRVQRTFAEIQKAKAGGDKSEPASPAKGDGAHWLGRWYPSREKC